MQAPSQVAIKAHQAAAHHRLNAVNVDHVAHDLHATNQVATEKVTE